MPSAGGRARLVSKQWWFVSRCRVANILRKTKHFGDCYMDSFWPQSGRDVQDNWMLRFCLFFPLWGQFNTVFFTHASTVNLLERVKGPLCALPHLWLILSISMLSFEPTFENICLQHARDWRYNALRLWIKRELLLPENTGFIKASKVITHPCSLAPSSAARRPQTWCWNRCGFWFSVKSGLHC